jgi:preprotein translocase subunit SecG
VKVKKDGAVGYGFGLVSEQSVHEGASGTRDAVNKVTAVLILFIICTNVVVFKHTNGVFKVHITAILNRRSGCQRKINCPEIRFINILIFPNDTTYDLS